MMKLATRSWVALIDIAAIVCWYERDMLGVGSGKRSTEATTAYLSGHLPGSRGCWGYLV